MWVCLVLGFEFCGFWVFMIVGRYTYICFGRYCSVFAYCCGSWWFVGGWYLFERGWWLLEVLVGLLCVLCFVFSLFCGFGFARYLFAVVLCVWLFCLLRGWFVGLLRR